MDQVDVPEELESKLPDTVTVLDGPMGGKVYIIGTAHFSVKSQEEVVEVWMASGRCLRDSPDFTLSIFNLSSSYARSSRTT